MATRTRQDPLWKNGTTVTATELREIDYRIASGINGDDGGSWEISGDTLEVGGEGMWCAGLWTISGSGVVTGNTTDAPIVLGDGDYFELHGAHTAADRALATNLGEGIWDENVDYEGGYSAPVVSTVPDDGARIACRLRVHDGATFDSVEVAFLVAIHTNVPVMPRLRVVRVDAEGTKVPLTSNDAAGFVSPPSPATGAAWRASGATQTLTINLDAGTIVDASAYEYWLEIIDETGADAVAGNIYFTALSSFSGIADNRPE